jgi:hypothetical protein
MRLVMVTFIAPGQPPEAEPMTVELDGDALALTLDDGGRLELSWPELRQAVEGEQAPVGRAA